jgi:hypothetical protein
MGKYRRMPADAYRQATLVLLRYPEAKEEYNNIFDWATTRDPDKKGGGAKPAHSDPTQAAAVRLTELGNDQRYQRIKREVYAVEEAVKDLDPTELEVIQLRYWKHRRGERKIRGYDYMRGSGYSRPQMQRIVAKVMRKLAVNLGEI